MEEKTDSVEIRESASFDKISAGGKIADLHTVLNVFSSERLDTEVFKEKVSPFIYYEGMTYQRKKRPDCSQKNLSRLIKTGYFTEVHGMVLEMLDTFHYMNAFMIRSRLKSAVYGKQAISIKTEKCRKLLKGMVENGLIQQYEFFHEDSQKKQQGSPFVYSISNGGINYLERTKFSKRDRENELFSISNVLEILSFNQFHILMENQYSDILLRSTAYGDSWKEAGIYGSYLFRLPDGMQINFFAFSVRNVPGWHESYIFSIRALQSYVQRRKIKNYFTLIVCETEHQAMECHRYLEICSGISIPVLYTTDSSIITSSNVFERLIEVKSGGNFGNRTIINLNFRN